MQDFGQKWPKIVIFCNPEITENDKSSVFQLREAEIQKTKKRVF